MVKRKKVIPARTHFTPSICLLLLATAAFFPSSSLFPLLSALPPHSLPFHLSFSPSVFLFLSVTLSLSLSLLRLPASLSFPLSWCKVMEAGVCGFPRARLRDYTARSHERFMMLGSVCVRMNVCHCRSGTDWKKGTRRRREKRKEGRGDRGYRLWDKLTVHSRANSPGCDYTTFLPTFRRHLGHVRLREMLMDNIFDQEYGYGKKEKMYPYIVQLNWT